MSPATTRWPPRRSRRSSSNACAFSSSTPRSDASYPRYAVPRFVGVDLTVGFSNGSNWRGRPTDVCGLTPDGAGFLLAKFWQWRWEQSGHDLELATVLDELRATECALLDGQQALASIGEGARRCERQLNTLFFTPCELPKAGSKTPGATYLLSSIRLFESLRKSGLPMGPPWKGGAIGEVYPASLWELFNLRSSKRTVRGRYERASLLVRLGIRLEDRID